MFLQGTLSIMIYYRVTLLLCGFVIGLFGHAH
jgi:hypothetical protein